MKKTIYVPTSRTTKVTSAFTLATHLASKLQAKVEIYPLEKETPVTAEQSYGDSQKNNELSLPISSQRWVTAYVTEKDRKPEPATIMELPLPAADFIVMDADFVRGRYEIATGAETEGTKGAYTSSEFMMDNYAIGTKGACAAHELPLHPEVEALMLQAHCPVLTVVTQKLETPVVQKVILVTDGEDGANPLYTVLVRLQRIFRFKLHLLHINRYFHHQPVISVINTMRELAKVHSFTNYQIHNIEDYTYEEGILHFANKVQPDMIVLPIDGHKIISRLLEEIFSQTGAENSIKYLLTYKVA